MGFQWSQHKEPNGVFAVLNVSRAVEAFSDAPDEVVAKQLTMNMGNDFECQAAPPISDASTHCVLKTVPDLKINKIIKNPCGHICMFSHLFMVLFSCYLEIDQYFKKRTKRFGWSWSSKNAWTKWSHLKTTSKRLSDF
jgi:hypothetical protein